MWCGWMETHPTGAGAASSRACTGTAVAKDDPLYSAQRTLHTGADLLTDKRVERLKNPVRRR